MQEDQVPRLRRFQAEHPDIKFTPPTEAGSGGQWHAHRGDTELAHWYDLRCMLDDLEWSVDGR